jgi:hypothetical protein
MDIRKTAAKGRRVRVTRIAPAARVLLNEYQRSRLDWRNIVCHLPDGTPILLGDLSRLVPPRRLR